LAFDHQKVQPSPPAHFFTISHFIGPVMFVKALSFQCACGIGWVTEMPLKLVKHLFQLFLSFSTKLKYM